MLKITLAVILISAVPYCNKCIDEGESCADSFSFNVVDEATGQNLVFGSSAVYDFNSFYLVTKLPGYQGKMSYPDINRFRSALLTPVDTFYLKLSVNDTDTLLMQYDFVKSKCCPNEEYGRVSGIKYNGIVTEKVNDIFILKK